MSGCFFLFLVKKGVWLFFFPCEKGCWFFFLVKKGVCFFFPCEKGCSVFFSLVSVFFFSL